MKAFHTVLLTLFILNSQAQLKMEVDKFSKDTSYTTGFIAIDGSYKERVILEATLKKSRLTLYLFLTTPDIHCFAQNAKVLFRYDNGNIDTLISTEKLNCKGEFTFYLDRQFPTNMTESPIERIRFFSTDGYFDIELSKSEEFFVGRKLLPKRLQELSELKSKK